MSATKKAAHGGQKCPSKPYTSEKATSDETILSFSKDFIDAINATSKALRPRQAQANKSQVLRANFFKVDIGNATKLFQYRIENVIQISNLASSTLQSPPIRTKPKPKRAPLPKGFQRSSKKEIDDKAELDAESAKKAAVELRENKPNDNNDSPQPVKLPRRMKRRLTFLLRDRMQQEGIKVNIASNYDTCLVTTEVIVHRNVPGYWRVVYYDEDEDCNTPNLREFDVLISPVIITDLLSAVKMITAAVPKAPMLKTQAATAVQTSSDIARATDQLNILFSHRPNLNTRRETNLEPSVAFIGANKFYRLDTNNFDTPPAPWRIKGASTPTNPGGVVAFPGFFRSIRASVGNAILLNINTTTSAFYAAGNLQDSINDFGTCLRFDLHNFLKGLRVRTTYLGQKSGIAKAFQPSTQRIHSLRGLPFQDQLPTPNNVYFEYYPANSDQPKEVTVGAYWKLVHKITLDSTDVVVDCGKGGYIPARYLEVLAGQPYRPKTEMIAHACRGPHYNYNRIMQSAMWLFGISKIDDQSPAICFSGLTVDQNMIKVPVSMLRHGNIRYASGSPKDHALAQGRWNLIGQQAVGPSPPAPFTVIELVRPGKRPCGLLADFATAFHAGLKRFGLQNFKSPYKNGENWGKHSLFLQSSKGQFEFAKIGNDAKTLGSVFYSLKAKEVRLVLVLLPDGDHELYGLIKRLGDITFGLHTICHVLGWNKSLERGRYLGPKLDSGTLANLHMKFNLKLSRRSANQALTSNTDTLLTQNVMMVGIDVTHPGPTAYKGAQSIAAVVSSVDKLYAQWPASLHPNPRPSHDGGQASERVLYLARMMEERLLDFKAFRNVLPDRLLVFRDGLSEAQFDMCKNLELPQIKQALHKVYGNSPKPPIILICSVKRHHARLFPDPPGAVATGILDVKGNPKPGVVVFDQITYGESNDFFLVSHETIQGTTRPTHYVVLHNEIGNLSISDIANTTHRLCYLFGRATRSVSLVPAAYYADLAADRARYYVRDQYIPKQDGVFNEQKFAEDLKVHPDLKHSMFYI